MDTKTEFILFNRRFSDNGFTLLEVMICVSIISIGFFGIYTLHTQSISASEVIQFYLKAPLIAQKKIAETHQETTTSLSEQSGTCEGENSGFLWKISPIELETEHLGNTIEKLKAYRLEVYNKTGSYEITVYRFSPENETP